MHRTLSCAKVRIVQWNEKWGSFTYIGKKNTLSQQLINFFFHSGTGHVAVGSIIEANNADIASVLGAKMVLVANGGCGRSFDELQLNYILCQNKNLDIAGVIINKVCSSKESHFFP